MIAFTIPIPATPLRLRAKIHRKGGLVSIGNQRFTGRKVGIAWRAPALSGGVYRSASWSFRDGGKIDDGQIRINH